MGFELLDHTADLKIKSSGSSLEEAFANAGKGLFSYMTDVSKVHPKITKQLEFKGRKKESLLYDFIAELIFYLDTEDLLLVHFDSLSIKQEDDKFVLSCSASGDTLSSVSVERAIKSMTYSEMEIKKEKDFFVIIFVVDI